MFNLVPILIGAAVGAGTSALFGKDPLKGAALGGLGGGLFGPAGGFGGASGASGGGAASGLSVAPEITAAAAGPAAGTTTFFGGPAAAFSAPTYFNPSYTSLGGLINPVDISGIKDYLPSAQALSNVGLSTAAQSLMRPPMQAPAGGISQGRPLDIAAVENLVSKRRAQMQTPGLMGNYFG